MLKFTGRPVNGTRVGHSQQTVLRPLSRERRKESTGLGLNYAVTLRGACAELITRVRDQRTDMHRLSKIRWP